MSFTKVVLTGTKDKIKAAFERFNTFIDDLLAITSGKGASQVGIYDAAANMSAANVEDALAEIYTDTTTVRALGEVFAENTSTTTGLTWGYSAGTVRFDNVITVVAAGTVSLTDSATNYIEVNSAGSVTRNTTAFTSGRIPIRQVITLAGVQTTSTDKRSWFQSWDVPLPVIKGGTEVATLTDHGILLGSGTGAITPLGVATNGQLPIGSVGADPVLAAPAGTANQITVTLGAGTITFSLPSALIPPGTVDPVGIVTLINAGLHVLDTDASHDLIIKPGSNLSADRILTIITGDAARTITLAGDLTTAGAVSVSAYGATLIDDANADTALSTLGVSTYAKTLLDDADAATAVATLGITATAAEVNTACDGATAKNSHTHAEGSIESAAISQAKLKTSMGSVSTTSTTGENLTLPGGEYGFYPQVKNPQESYTVSANIATALTSVPYITNIFLATSSAGFASYAQQRYVTSSGEVHWVFLLRDKATKKVLAGYQAPDHPCFGNGGDPELVPHPFPGYDSTVHEIIVINPSKEEVMEIRKATKATNLKRDFLEVLQADYEIDEFQEAEWPSIPVTVGLQDDYEMDKGTVIKQVIPKPNYVSARGLKIKGGR